MTLFPALTLLVALHAAQPAACGRMRGNSSHGDGARTTIVFSDDDRCFEVRIVGTATFTDDDADVATLSPGGSFEVNDWRGSRRRALTLVERGGRLERTYTENGVARPAEQGAEWLRGVVLDVVRGSGVGAEARVARIRRQRGVGGVLDEIAELRSDYIRRLYFQHLLALDLSSDDVRRVATAAGDRIESDYERGTVLRAAVAQRGDDRGVVEAVTRAVSGMGSDYERGRVLLALVERDAASTSPVPAAFFRAVDNISSDYERRRVLAALAARESLGAESVRALLASASRISSDHDKSTVLLTVVAARPARLRDADTRAAFDAAMRTISSDSDYRRVARVFER